MKHVVNLILSQPDHDFVSMRSRKQEKTYMLEARNADEALLRATRKFKELGFYVHGASIVEQKEEAPVAKPLTEGVAEVQAAQEKRKAAMKKATAEVDKSEVQDKAGKAQAGSALAQYLKNKASTMKEEVEVTSGYLEEKLGAGDPASKWIHDFVHSDNPKFEGKSKAERIKMALGAKYAADRAVKEEAEQIDEVSFSKPFTSRKPAMSSTAPSGEEREKVNPEIKKQLEKDPETMDAINKQVAASKAKNPFREEVELNEALSAEDWHDKIDNADTAEDMKKVISKVPTKHLQYLHHWNMGLSGTRQHPARSHIKAELKSRNALLSSAESEKRFDEEVEQIDELNKETLASYIGKAAHSVGTKERVAKGIAVNAAMTKSKKRRDMYLKSAQTWRDAAARRVTGIKTAAGKLAKEEVELEEAVSRKDFKQVAGIIKEIPDAEKRKQLAQHHAEIFANQNPRFDHSRFYAAAGVNLGEEAEQVEEAKADPVAKAKELLDQAEKGTYKGSAAKLQKALEKAKSKNFDQGKGYKLEEDAEQLDETGVVKKTNKTLKNVMAASKGAKINAAMGDAKMDPADYGYNKAQHLNKAIGRMVSRGAAFVEEGVEQLDEKSQEAKQKKAWGKTLARIRGARIMKDSGITPQNIDLKTKQGKYYTQKDLNLQAGRAAQRGDLDESTEGATPSTPKEKELAAKAGDPNKITKKDVLAARGVKLDEVTGSYKDIATKKAEDKRLAATQKALDAAKKNRKTVLGDTAHKVNTAPTTGDSSSSLGVGGK